MEFHSHHRKNRSQKNVVGIVVEGKNKTERIYFNNFKRRDSRYSVTVVDSDETDPTNMVKRAKRFVKEKRINLDKDHVFIVMDGDANKEKLALIEQLKEKNPCFHILVSNPCIEFWFLLHFEYTTRHLQSGQCIQYLKQKYLPDYEKYRNIYPMLKDNEGDAYTNLNKLSEYFDMSEDKPYNPFTEINQLLDILKL